MVLEIKLALWLSSLVYLIKDQTQVALHLACLHKVLNLEAQLYHHKDYLIVQILEVLHLET